MRKDMDRRREQQRGYAANYYANNKQKQLDANNKRRRELFEWFREYKTTLKCSMCPENHPACLDFHHRDPNIKSDQVRRIIGSSGSKRRVLEEIAKCDILCANCHRKLHHSGIE